MARRNATESLWVLVNNARARRFYWVDGWEPDGARQPLEMGATTVDEVRYRRVLP